MINPFKKTYSTEELNIFRFLGKIKIFKNLEFEEMALFLPFLHERSYQKDEVVFFRGDPSQALYIIKSGEVVVNIDVNDEFEELTRIVEGHSFGESCLLEGEKRLLNVVVDSEEAILYVIPQGSIFDVFEDNPKVKAKMLESLGRILNSYNENLFKAYRSSLGFFNLGQIYKEGNDDLTSKN